MIRRYGEPVKSDIRYRRRPGIYAILPLRGSLLLTHQADPIPEFQLPGGGIDPGESPIPALHREVYEETGWSIANVRRVGCYRRFTYMPDYDLWAEKICHIYTARPVRRLGPPTEEGHTAIWMDFGNAVEFLSNEGDEAFLRNFLQMPV